MTGRARGAIRVLVAAVLLLAGAAATVSAPTDDELQDPIESRGVVGRTVTARTAEIRVDGVRAADRLALPKEGIGSATSGVWIVLDVTVACRLTACSFAGSELRSRGRSYDAAVIAPIPSFVVLNGEPGLRYRTTALFEVPRSVLGDRRAELVAQDVDTSALDGARRADPAAADRRRHRGRACPGRRGDRAVRAWLRSNAVGLACVAGSLPLLAVVLVVVPLRDAGGQEEVVATVPAGRSGELAGLRYRVLADAEFGPEQRVTTPDGTVLAAAAIEVRPIGSGGTAASCTFRLSAPADGGRRSWKTVSSTTTEGYGYARGQGYEETCDPRPDGAYRAETVFLVPEGTLDDAVLEVIAPAEYRYRVLRLRLPAAAPAPSPSPQTG